MRDLTEIAMAFIGVATLALLVSQSEGTARVVGAVTEGFSGLLRTVTLQNNYGTGTIPGGFR